MICPACKNSMIVVEYKRIELDYCTYCSGVWFDSGELELLLESTQSLEKSAQEVCRPLQDKASETKRKCPICHQSMIQNHIGGKLPVLIDICPTCDGLFFDGGELNQFLKQLTIDTEGGKRVNNKVTEFLGDLFKSSK
jgi:uncharacterized protein